MFLSHNFFWPLGPSPFHDTLKTLFSSSHPDVGGPQPSLLSSLFCLSAITHPFISTFHLYPVIYTPVLPLPHADVPHLAPLFHMLLSFLLIHGTLLSPDLYPSETLLFCPDDLA